MNTPKIILTAMLWVAATAVFSQTVSHEYYFLESEFQTMIVEDFTSITCLSDNYYLKEEPGKPALPVRSIKLMIPSDAKYVSHSIKEKVVPYLEDCTVFPMQPPVPTDGTIAHWVKPDSSIYDGDGVFPKEISQFSGMHIMGNYRIITIEYCPFRYYPKENRVELVSRLDLTIELGRDQKPQRRYENEIHFKMVKSVVDNPQDVIYTSGRSPVNPGDVQYLIITDANMIDDFQPLADWKTQKGIPAEVISIQSILSTYSGATDQLKIKTCLQDYYNNKGLVWVLLGGDNTVVPDQDCYAIVNASSSSPSEDNTIPADLFYCCFDNAFDWNADGDNQVGEVEDNVDMAPEIFIGRAPVQTESQAAVFVAKTLNYEQNPPTNNFASKFVSSGLQLWNNWSGHSDAYWRSEAMWNEVIAPIWTGTKYKYYDTDTDFPGGEYFDVTQQNTVDILNDGYNIFWMATHGGQQSWAMESGDGFYSSSASALTNYMRQGLIVTMACNTNAFETSVYDDDPCLSEAFLRNGNGGAVLYHGSSRYGWGNGSPYINHGSSMEYARDFFYALFSGNPTSNPQAFAAVSAESKLDNIGNAGSDGSYRWLMYSINNMGDPEMDVFTQDPGVFNVTHPTSVIAGVPHDVTVHTGVSGALVCLTDENTSNPVYVYGYADNNGDCTLSVTPAIGYEITVTVTAPDYKPSESTILNIPPNGSYVVVDYITAVTTDGDNNLEAGESATIDVKLINFGNEAANNISLQLDKTDPDSYITITDNSETVTQTLNSGDTVIISAAFALDVDFGVYNGYELVLSTGVNVTSKDMTWYTQDFTVYSNLGPWLVDAVDGVDKVNLSWRAPFGGWQGYYPTGGWFNTSLNHRAVLFEMSDFQMTYPVEISRLTSLFYEGNSWNGNDQFRFYIIDEATDEVLFISDWITAPSYGWAYHYFDYPFTVYSDFYVSIETADQVGGYPNSLVTENIGVDNTHSWGGSPGEWTKLGFDFSHHVYVMDAASGVVKDLSVNSQGVSQNNAPKDFIPGKGPKYSFQGYNVYRDGVKLNTTPVTDNTFADDPLANGIYEYHVTAVYAEGESCWSNIDYGVSVDENTVFFDHFTDGDNWDNDSGCDWDDITSEYYSAPSCYTDSPYGDYTNNMDCRIWTAPAVSMLNENAETATVFFRTKYDLELNYDTCFFEVSTDFYNNTPIVLGYFTGTNNTWTLYDYDISEYIGIGELYFSFRMKTDQATTADGIYIDDFTVKVFENGNAPARFLEANMYYQDVHLSWSPPMAGGEGWFSYFSGLNYYNPNVSNIQSAQYFNLAELGNQYPMVLERIIQNFYDNTGNGWNGNDRFTFCIYNKNGTDLVWESEQIVANSSSWQTEYILPNPITLTEDVLIAVKPVSASGGPFPIYQGLSTAKSRGYNGTPEHGWNSQNGNWGMEIYLSNTTKKQNNPNWGESGVALGNIVKSSTDNGLFLPIPSDVLANIPPPKAKNILAKNVSGYNIYRNGSVVNTSPVTTLWYQDKVPHQGLYDYVVKAVYTSGESVPTVTQQMLCNDVVIMDPPVASANDEVTLWFDPAFSCQAGNGNSLEGYGEVRLHSGIGIGGSTWNNYVPWDGTGANSQSTHLTNTWGDHWYITLTPSDYYGIDPSENMVDQLCMVFNGGDQAQADFGTVWAKEGKAHDGSGGCMDIFMPLEYRETLFSDDFENGTSNWSFTGSWGLTESQFFSSVQSLTDSPGGSYSTPSETSATQSIPIDLVGKWDVELEFRYMAYLRGSDTLYVEASSNNFSTSQILSKQYGNNWKPWDKVVVDMNAMAGEQNVKIRFRLNTQDSRTSDGVYIDDVVIRATEGSFMITELIPHTSNGDDTFEAGESVTFDVVVYNGGGTVLSNLPLTLSANDPDGFLALTDDQELISSLAVGEQLTITDAFALDVAMNVTDEYGFTLNVGVDIPSDDMTWFDFSFTAYSDIYPLNLVAENGNGEVDLSWHAPFRGWYSYQNGGNNGVHWSEEERGVLYTASDFGLTYPMYFTTIAHRFYEVEADPWNGNNKFRYNIYDYATNDLLFESEWLYAPSDDYFYYTFPEPYAVNGDFIVAVEVFDAGGTNFPSSARNDGTTWPTCHSYLGSGETWTTYPHEWMTHLYVTGDGGTATSPDGMAIGYNGGSPSISVPDGSTKGGAKSDIIGFNIYRDGSKINGDTPVDGYSYTDTPLAVGNYDYYTTAVYAGGESCPSNTDNAYSLEDHVIFFEDFENVAWYSFNCGWGFTTEYAYSGNKSIANAPWGNYVDNQDCWFRMYPELNLLNVNSDSAKLSLKAKFDIQAESDTCFVEVTEDFNSGDWQTVGCFTGTAFSWQQYSFDISDFIGKQMTVIFRMNTDESGNADGIYIDDVAVSLYDNNYAPPKNVEANAYASDVHLKWTWPMAGGEGWFSNWSWSNSSYFNWGEKASYIDLAEFGNPYPMLLTKVRHQFIDWEGTNWNGENEFKIRVWEKDGQTLIFESEVLYASHGSYEYELSEPLELTDDVLVTIKPMNVYPTSAYMSVTNNTGHGYLGNPDQGWEPLNGNWATEIYLAYCGAKDNTSGKWLQAGIELENVVEPTNPSGKQTLTAEMRDSLPVFKGNSALAKSVSGFNVYRDGEQINTAVVPNDYYYDTVPHQGVYDYYVKAVYPGDELSVRTAITSVTVDDVVLMYPLNAAPDEELTLWFDPYYSCEAGNSNSLEGSSEVRLHSGVGLNGISWSQSVSWDGTGYDGTNTYLTSQPEGQYTFMYTPSAFYGVSPDTDKVDHLDMVFNSGNSTSSPWDKEGKAPDGFGGCIDINVPLNFRTLLFEDDFESGMSNWITTGTWNASTDMFFTATHCLSDSPWSWYSGGTETTATLATGLDLSGYSSPVLEYNILHVLDNGDHVYVDISTDDFANFTVLKEYAYYDWLPWLQESISLDLYENQSNVKIRFRLVTDNVDDGDGVFIDDVKIKGYQSSLVIEPIPYTQDFAVYPTPDWEQYEGQLTTSSVLVPYNGTGDYDGWHEDGFNCHNTSGTGAIRGNIWSTNHYYWYNTPFIDLGTNTGGVILRFDMAGSYWNSCALANLAANDQFAVVISTDGVTWSSANTLIEWVEGDTLPEYGETYEVDLSAYSGMVKFGFYHGHNGSSTDLEVFVDNVYVGFDYSPITIAEARALPVGSTVCVEGIVTNGGEFGNIRYLQDATGAIAAYGAAQNGSVYLGDEVTYEGELYNYYELLEISPIYNFEIQNSGQPLPLPINVEPYQWADSLESHLMVVDTGYFLKSNNVWSSRMFPSGDTLLFVTPGYDTAALFVDPNTDLDQFYIPDCPVAITGILGQYSSDPDQGFQLLPRQLNDFENVAIAPSDVQTDVSSNDVTLSWNSPIYNHNIPGLNEYIIYYNTSGTFSESDYHTTVYNEDPVIINDLENGLYYFWIKAVYDNTLDVLSDSVIAQVDYEFVLSGLVTDVNTGLGIPDVEMVFQSSDISSVYTNTNGYYEATVPGESFIRLVPEHACYSFTPYQYYLPGGITGNTTLDFTGDLDEITISGNVTDNAGAGIILPVHFITSETLDTTTVYTNGNGLYSNIQVPCDWCGYVLPELESYFFTPDSIVFENQIIDSYNNDFVGTPDSFPVSGTVTWNGQALEGVLLNFEDIFNDPTTASDGTYTCYVPAGWAGYIDPVKTGFTFIPSLLYVPSVSAPVTGQDFEATNDPLFINGVVKEGEYYIQGVEMVVTDGSGGVIETVYTNSVGYYDIDVPYGFTGTVTPNKTDFNFSPTERIYNNLESSLGQQNYEAINTTQYAVSGIVTDGSGPVEGVTMTLSGSKTTTLTASDGSYSFTVARRSSGTVTPSKDGYTFVPESESFSNITTNISNFHFTGSVEEFAVSGTVTFNGSPLSGVLLDFDNIVNDPVSASDGTYSCVVPYGWSGHITPSLSGYSFDPAYHAVGVVTTPLSNQDFEAIEGNGLPPGWNFVNTGSNHTINIFDTAPMIDGVPLSYGSWIGVFFDDNGVEKCAGAIEWQGAASPIIAAQGDDSTTPGKDGFSDGEVITYKFYTNDVKGTEMYAAATYSSGPEVYTTNGTSVIPLLQASTSMTHTVQLPEGWSGVSSYIVPDNDSTSVIFAPVLDDFVILKSMTQAYWPPYANQIVHWNPYEGYKLKLNAAGEVNFVGGDTEKTLTFGEGWCLLPVLTNQNVDATAFFAPVIENLIIAKTIGGMGVYWPAVGVQTLLSLTPGESYMVKFSSPSTLSYPPLSSKSTPPIKGYPNPVVCDMWESPVNTGNTHIMAFSDDASQVIENGDFVGVFDINDRCVGLTEFSDTATLMITVYGDDPTTPEKDGLFYDEAFVVKVYNPTSNEVKELLMEYDQNLDVAYREDGLTLITKTTVATTGIGSLNLRFTKVYPNPTSDIIHVYVPGSETISLTARVIASNGGAILTELEFNGQCAINVHSFPAGVYLIQISDEFNEPVYRRFIKK